MSGINTEYSIYLKVLTPVHIGGAQEKNLQEGLDYIQFNNGSTWQINWEKVYQIFNPDEVANAIINGTLKKLLSNEIEDVAFEIEQTFGDTREIKAFIRDGLGRVFIPGSSIKGAMKNWIHASLENELNVGHSPNLLGKFESDVFRFIEPADCYMNEDIALYPIKTFNLIRNGRSWEGGWKHKRITGNSTDFSDRGFVTDFECFCPEAKGEFSFRLREGLPKQYSEKIFDRSPNAQKSYKAIFQNEDINQLFKLINKQTKKHIKKELQFFEKFNEAEYSEDIIRTYEDLLKKMEEIKANQCILRLSAGSGFHGITGDYQYEDHTQTGIWTEEDAKKYKLNRRQSQDYVGSYMKFKSRKIAFTANDMYPMGFVLLSTKPLYIN